MPKTVLRGGYGIGYTQFNRAGGENNLTYNGPNVVNANINNSRTERLQHCAPMTRRIRSSCFRQTQQGYARQPHAPAYFNPAR